VGLHRTAVRCGGMLRFNRWLIGRLTGINGLIGRRGWTRTSDPQLRRLKFSLTVTRFFSHLRCSPVQFLSKTPTGRPQS